MIIIIAYNALMAKRTSRESKEISKVLWIASSVIVALWVAAITYAAIGVMGPQLLFIAVPYIGVLFFTWPLLKPNSKSETYKRAMILLNLLAVGSILWLAWNVYDFMLNYTW